jgi:hypothetical protein
MRMSMRRFTRLTNAFSKKLENHCHAIALHFMHYNFCRVHQTTRVTPAMEAGPSDHVWTLGGNRGAAGLIVPYNPPVRRLARILLNAATVLSLLLCAASAALWVRSYRTVDDVSYVADGPPPLPSVSYFANSVDGGITFDRFVRTAPSPQTPGRIPTGFSARHGSVRRYRPPVNLLGFGADVRTGIFGVQYEVVVPYYAVVLITSVLPALGLWRYVRRPRRAGGHCPKCGYDLRATPERCPECGTLPGNPAMISN